jgi:hypothetical protein
VRRCDGDVDVGGVVGERAVESEWTLQSLLVKQADRSMTFLRGWIAAAGLAGLGTSACDALIGLEGPAGGSRDATVSDVRVRDAIVHEAASYGTGVDANDGAPGGEPQDATRDGPRDAPRDHRPPGDVLADAPPPDGGAPLTASVLQFHMNASRDGHYVDPSLTPARAGSLAIDPTFDAPVRGPLRSQPLYVSNGVNGRPTIYVADDSNDVYALDEQTGAPFWSITPLAPAAGRAGSGCGNVRPVGVTGTPVIDLTSRTMYLVTASGVDAGIKAQQIHALSIDTGAETSGWPIDVSHFHPDGGVAFDPVPHQQRGALALVNGNLYVPFGGEAQDCGDFRGWVVTVPVTDPSMATAYQTPAKGGGIWAVGGIASDGTDVFATTGNARVQGLAWTETNSEAVLRFHDGSFDFSLAANFFTPSNWTDLDGSDDDLGGCGPLVVDVPGATPSALIVQLGKSGVLHIVDRTNLGGIGTGDGQNMEGLFSVQVAGGSIRTAPAAYTTSERTYVVFHADAAGNFCPGTAGGS